ncbi:TetR/AcrR family transcriptional regulator C-terminal domain-containing protein [Actinomadura macrotermitis]|uniref:Tetracycline repressor protein n=1 Tax=Actinomadura macrotermitis TaxID=2585200 RepID=A0A7K0BW11_9ACTN|nr:TetR/AcrR family transcriptional regulator C-terminal domain-containing protein [Actinomadura macrotermitis]MQY05347.1 Tetracycline repressor protein [Actinomadura macrotermitis]
MKLERDEIVRTAIRLLDEVGLDKLSLRGLAKELNVQAPALYWHFKNKQELLDQMVSTMAAESYGPDAPLPGQSWDDWLAGRARALATALRSHRDAVRLAAGSRPTAERAGAVEGMIGALCDAGFTPGEALSNILVITDYAAGTVLEEQSGRDRADGAPTGGPLLTAAAAELGDTFEYGLALLIDGMRARLARR